MKHKSLKAMILTTALALSTASMAMAVPTDPGPPVDANPDSEYNKNKDTTISIITSSLPDFNISYTVPLYVTMAVASQKNEVKTPDNYDFINTTPENNNASVDVGVTSMSFELLNGATYHTVATEGAVTDTETDKDKIYLTIGQEPMPEIAADATQKVKTWVPSGASVFTKTDNSGPEPIHSNARVNLPITGKVAKVTRTDAATAAQFRVKYTVSVLGAGGQTLGGVYAGSNRVEAGLGEWTTN